MSDARTLLKLEKSYRDAPKDVAKVGPADPGAPVELTIILKPKAPIPTALGPGKHLRREEFEANYASDSAVFQAVVSYAQEHGLTLVGGDEAHHEVKLAGPASAAIAAFPPDSLDLYRKPDGSQFLARSGHISVPAHLKDRITAVMGFDERPVARPHFRRLDKARAATVSGSFDPKALAKIYEFPNGDGNGEAIAIIELGGGYRPQDLEKYFADQGGGHASKVTSIGVGGAHNQPTGQANGPDAEVELDIEVAGAVAHEAAIVVYFAKNTSSGFLGAITAAIHDARHDPSVISISWGGPESGWSVQDMDAMDQAFQSAAALGITVCVASGDNGALDNSQDGKPSADFPASSPHVLACGGTSLKMNGAQRTETVWNDGQGGASGGGISTHFPVPDYQRSLQLPVSLTTGASGRGVPDVAGDADPATGYNVRVDGTDTVVGGTSAVAPLWAAMIAITNQVTGTRCGLLNPVLYANAAALNDVVQGNNQVNGQGYEARQGWDPCTGLGSPIGSRILNAVLEWAKAAKRDSTRFVA